jgi:hypothetical protein
MRAARHVTVLTLLYIVLGFCLASIVLSVIPLLLNQIVSSARDDLFKSIAAIYATPVAVASAAALARGGARVRYPRVAAILVGLWGLVMLIPFLLLVITSNTHVTDVSAFCTTVAKDWTFLISGVLAFNASIPEKNGR